MAAASLPPALRRAVAVAASAVWAAARDALASRRADARFALRCRSLGVGRLRAERESLPGREGLEATRESWRGVGLRPAPCLVAGVPPSVPVRWRGWRMSVGPFGACPLAGMALLRWRGWCGWPVPAGVGGLPAVSGSAARPPVPPSPATPPAPASAGTSSARRSYMRLLTRPSANAMASSEASWSPSPSRSPPSTQSAAPAALRRRPSSRTALAAAADAVVPGPRLAAESATSSEPRAMPELTASVMPSRATEAALPPVRLTLSGRLVMRGASAVPWGRARAWRGAPCPLSAWPLRPRRAWC